MTTSLAPDFLVVTMNVSAFRNQAMTRTQGALLTLALAGTMDASQLPGEICNGDPHLAGCASGALVAQGLICVVGRVKSSNACAKGRKVNQFAIAEGRRGTVLTWLARNGLPLPEPTQQTFLLLTA